MSGLELLFIDGGATVTALAGAGAAALGYKQRNDDDDRFVGSEEELCWLRSNLRQAHNSLDAGHSALTAAWRGPLSLFSSRDESAAIERGVPKWAASVVRGARGLVDEAAGLGDLADVYEAQLRLAEQGDSQSTRGVLRAPVLELSARIEGLAQRSTEAVPAVVLSRDAFDGGGGSGGESKALLQVWKFLEPPSPIAKEEMELPLGILRDRGRLGEFWRSAETAGQSYGQALSRLTEQHRQRLQGEETGNTSKGTAEEIEYSSYVYAYMSNDSSS
mmetsp:Transcript_128307/g.256261  ORF Transcript_128307/g.256261 Transcript_128307/m.256261 type:complete len:275 (-) Transcript_128307:23-847(-)|eukprot:CAMPEP_0172868148 /NCGR_PEP_ID=MMETSP1075-20121228/85584_1 /TAXON_ID=2916 /ORGANISM="Ceratium fusus, Strain PA161109" /LENGTH=274 /DNA_ID=CAMNT_0013717677 /DNA_START=107 /DNA_END=931 /DNA_ORIENTATION=+